jgi:DNA-binding MarR family transcriptional regulator
MSGGDHNTITGLRLQAFLPYRLSVLTNRVSRTLARLYAERFDLSVPQWRVLAVLGESSGLYADDICRITEMDKVTVSRAVHALREQGRLERHRDGSDGRRARIELTQAGRDVYAGVVPLALELEEQLLGALDRSERAGLDQLLTSLAERAAQLDGDCQAMDHTGTSGGSR